VLWKLRVIVYGTLAAIGALVLIGGGDDAPAFLEGRTAQDLTFRMELADGRPANVGTYFDATCEQKGRWGVRWWSFDGKTTRFRFDDGRLRIGETVERDYDSGWTGERKFSLEARVDDDGARGTMSFVETFRRESYSYRCASGPVAFKAG
jgi:hypothetical protein